MCVDINMWTQLSFGGNLDSVLSSWDYALMALAKAPDEDLVRALLEQEFRKCKALAPAFMLYDYSPEGHANRSLVFLYASACSEVVCRQR